MTADNNTAAMARHLFVKRYKYETNNQLNHNINIRIRSILAINPDLLNSYFHSDCANRQISPESDVQRIEKGAKSSVDETAAEARTPSARINESTRRALARSLERHLVAEYGSPHPI